MRPLTLFLASLAFLVCPGIALGNGYVPPGVPGPFAVGSADYDFSEDENQWWMGRVYFPTDGPSGGPFNLVIISHADHPAFVNLNEAHLQYGILAEHLASHGLVVASINRYRDKAMFGAINYFRSVLRGHLDYLYSPASPISGVITDDVGIIGHSAGGKSVTRHAGEINASGLKLRALAVLAPTIDADTRHSFAGITEAFLGMHGHLDTDLAAFGNKAVGKPMNSTFKLFDDAGVTSSANIRTVVKDMIFLEGHSHFFQNNQAALTYLNAFMQLYLNQKPIYNRFLKHQETPPSLAGAVMGRWLQHADTDVLCVANFENGNAHSNILGGSIDYSVAGISHPEAGLAFEIDDFSPHQSRVLKFDWAGEQGPDEYIRFGLGGTLDLSAYRFVSFRITQVFDLVENESGDPINFSVVLETNGGDSAVSIDTVSEPLHFPVRHMWVPPLMDEATKNAMRTYLIPLGAFVGANLNEVTAIRLDFTGEPGGPTTMIMDDLEITY